MPNLVQSLGRDFFLERVVGCYFPHEGRVLRVSGLRNEGRSIVVFTSSAPVGSDARVDQELSLSADVLPSYETLAAPDMGYRKCGNFAFRAHRDQRATHSPGFRSSSYVSDWANSSRYSFEVVGQRMPNSYNTLHSLYFPEYDGAGSLPSLLNGSRLCVVLDKDTLIEPNTRTQADYYDVWVRGLLIGHISPDGRVHNNTPSENRAIVERIIANAS